MSAPSTSEAVARPDWRESLSLAADLALLGIVVTIACVPLVTAGGALATASVAAEHAVRHRSLPPMGDLLRTLRGAILPGLAASVTLIVVAAALVLDLRSVSAGRVPGGVPVLVSTVVVCLVALAVAALTLVEVGRTGGRGWWRAVRGSAATIWARPVVGAAVLPVVLVPAVLASAIPVTAPLFVGLGLFALHVVARRLSA